MPVKLAPQVVDANSLTSILVPCLTSLVAEFIRPKKCTLFIFRVEFIRPKKCTLFIFRVGNIIPKSVKCIHSATKHLTNQLVKNRSGKKP